MPFDDSEHAERAMNRMAGPTAKTEPLGPKPADAQPVWWKKVSFHISSRMIDLKEKMRNLTFRLSFARAKDMDLIAELFEAFGDETLPPHACSELVERWKELPAEFRTLGGDEAAHRIQVVLEDLVKRKDGEELGEPVTTRQ